MSDGPNVSDDVWFLMILFFFDWLRIKFSKTSPIFQDHSICYANGSGGSEVNEIIDSLYGFIQEPCWMNEPVFTATFPVLVRPSLNRSLELI